MNWVSILVSLTLITGLFPILRLCEDNQTLSMTCSTGSVIHRLCYHTPIVLVITGLSIKLKLKKCLSTKLPGSGPFSACAGLAVLIDCVADRMEPEVRDMDFNLVLIIKI